MRGIDRVAQLPAAAAVSAIASRRQNDRFLDVRIPLCVNTCPSRICNVSWAAAMRHRANQEGQRQICHCETLRSLQLKRTPQRCQSDRAFLGAFLLLNWFRAPRLRHWQGAAPTRRYSQSGGLFVFPKRFCDAFLPRRSNDSCQGEPSPV